MKNEEELCQFVSGLKHVTEQKKKEFILNCHLLFDRGLGKINDNVLNNRRRNCEDFLTEHNFAVNLIKNNPDAHIQYEPCYSSTHGILERPIDFYLENNSVFYWFQVKTLNPMKRENMKNNILKNIKTILGSINGNYFVSISLDDTFIEKDIVDLVGKIKINAENGIIGRGKLMRGKEIIAKYDLFKPNKTVFEHITIASTSDTAWVSVDEETHISNSLSNAYGAFKWLPLQNELNFIVQMADLYDDYEISNVVFGKEVVLYNLSTSSKSSKSLKRKPGGLFFTEGGERINGVIALRTKESRLDWDFDIALFTNEMYPYTEEQISKVLHIDRIYHSNDFM